MNMTKLGFIMIMIVSTLITLSSNNWISMWMGLEMNMMAFLPAVVDKKYKYSSMAAMMYFLVQSMSSLLFMFSLMMKVNINFFNEILTLSLIMKLGGAPFHMWVPEVMSKLSWGSCLLLSTWQKIAPLSMLMNNQNNNAIMTMSIIMSSIMGAIGGLNQSSLRKIMGYSSINHLSWMMMNNTTNSWIMYISIYSLIMGSMCYLFNYYKMMIINQINTINMSNSEKMCLSISMLSMGGLPPFLGFLPKWMVIQNLVNENNFIMLTILIVMSLITLAYYTRIMIKMMMLNSSVQKWMTLKSKTNINLMILMMNLSLPLMMITNFK